MRVAFGESTRRARVVRRVRRNPKVRQNTSTFGKIAPEQEIDLEFTTFFAMVCIEMCLENAL